MLAALLPLLAVPAAAHMTMWHPAMYGFRPDDLEYSQAATPPPLGAAFDQWWFRGAINEPPADGTFMELPAGGVFTGEISNNKIYTSWGKKPTPDTGKMASSTQGNGLLHSLDRPFGMAPEQTKEVMGCGLGIVYESDVHKIKPEDFAIISTNRYCPWYRDVDFHIPKGLPACPEGGCHCMWGWIHNERGGGQELYFTGYRCNVTGDTGTIPLPKPAIARKCPSNKNNCTVGAKQPLYWMVAEEGRNNHQGYSDAPFYNEAYGWKNGAQDDLWDIDLGTTWLNSSDQAPIPDAAGAWHDPIIQRDANAPVGKVSGPGAVNSPDSNATPSNSSNPATDSSASVSPSGSSASTASSNPTVSASGSSSGPVVSPSAVPGLNPDDSNLKVEPSGAELPGLSFAGASSAGASSSAAAGTSAHPTGSGLSNSTVSAGSDYSSASAGSSSSTAPSGSATSGPPKKCKKRKRAHRLRL
ncbi:hypothetical protein CcaverHIS002_0105370 [Cutaneotrichosporon cavernicola]|uniref:Uncharacterized protein n=1 Tax=Cutaneotrichosporon cavernicola TaxID=279322 RepID=A0AA48IHY5_9TREE|nr:uncharacterized protein CcaverHIS019_0105310 [Cutaneotrichosporon cavernicola]BEI80008.1 hypothetical protein CcaverHIS002_0105370 [Cutaneotrichosporon cavernicola]BEI87813.1 hypothetical protein CcaverHIS019_0105310 [Cutaneotrichosporon cavernicola]BEI95587.1 hypothetical protein CcaverHIS631_0105360 [Cutaneotrichosporon cavernicola]BEJ03361.1 hypothetical protein CcaverHIS641_0105360 [Cutaneotrichosporon cavernicola]